MPISEASATALCREVVQSLTQWRTFPALLQVGGIESRGASRILLALEKWLDTFAQDRDLLVLPEYRLSPVRPIDETTDKPLVKAADQLFGGGRIDYALVSACSVGEAVLRVATVLEVKTSYLGQGIHALKRPIGWMKSAFWGANQQIYRELCKVAMTSKSGRIFWRP